ncbi:MAG: cysteine hydrolase, partial [Alphaproteobacteria bacterium]|nr:cysteine hydrolase [Alphaproteobacteria bacterium]
QAAAAQCLAAVFTAQAAGTARVAHLGIDMQRVYCDPSPGGIDDALLAHDIAAMVGRVDKFTQQTRGVLSHVWVNHTNRETVGPDPETDGGLLSRTKRMIRDVVQDMVKEIQGADRRELRQARWNEMARREMFQLQAAPDDLVIGKPKFDAFARTTLDATLRARDVKAVVLTGLFLDQCVKETALTARKKGYEVFLAEDLTIGSGWAAPHYVHDRLAAAGVHVVRSDKIRALVPQ